LGHLKNFLYIVGLPARNAGDGDLACNKSAAADRKWPIAQTADDRRCSAGSGRLDDLIGGFRITDGYERLVPPAVGELNYGLHRIIGAGINGVRRAELSCGF